MDAFTGISFRQVGEIESRIEVQQRKFEEEFFIRESQFKRSHYFMSGIKSRQETWE